MKKIRIIQYGNIPYKINYKKILSFKSSAFEIVGEVEKFNLPNIRNGYDYSTYPDACWSKIVKIDPNVDFTLVITYCFLECNHYSRQINKRLTVFTLKPIVGFLTDACIPLENAILKMLYACALYYPTDEICHNETRGCLYDMNGHIPDLVISYSSPKLCVECENRLSHSGVSITTLKKVKKELNKLRKPFWGEIYVWARKHPFVMFIAGSVFSAVLDKIIF